jgi:hypothetical protein
LLDGVVDADGVVDGDGDGDEAVGERIPSTSLDAD